MDDPVKDALRLTDASYAKLSGEIERNKKTARTEMIRVGISAEKIIRKFYVKSCHHSASCNVSSIV